MNIALLTITSLSLVTSAGCLAVMLKTAHELKIAKTQVESDVATFKAKTDRNIKRLKSALGEMEL